MLCERAIRRALTPPLGVAGIILPIVLVLVVVLVGAAPPRPADAQTGPGQGIDAGRLSRIDGAVEAAIQDGQLPGAVVLVWHRGRIVYERAFGARAVIPTREPMTTDTVFDLASLTKVVATTTAVMMLIEEGAIGLDDPVALHLPGFERHDKGGITIHHLLTHVSGLRPDLPLEEEFDGADVAIARALDERQQTPPGTTFVYSDINFLLLAEIVARVSGRSFERFVTARIFEPLGMTDTMFNPPASLRGRIAPTERCTRLGWPCGAADGVMLRGVVHDPTARRMGGVAGHAGLFSTAADMARFGAMLLGGSAVDGARLLSPLTVARMTTTATPAGLADRRGLGWDIDSRYSRNRGEIFSDRSFGHTGFTGTSIWVDPPSQTVVLFLSSRVHPDGRGNVTALRGRVATLAAAAVRDMPVESAAPDADVRVDAGIDVLRQEAFRSLRGARVGLVTNQTGRARDGVSTIDLLDRAPDLELVALLSPEHGIRGTFDDRVPDTRDATTRVPVYSLYGDTRRPTARMLAGVDTVVVDLQGAGARFYTYMTTMAYVMEEAARGGQRVVVLDRPNPITGGGVEGPLLDETARGFTGYYPMPVRHGLTMGELARLFNTEREIGVELDVISLRWWRRGLWFDETGLTWVNPSPNLRSVTQTTLYPGIGAIEGTNVLVGRGTDTPFEQVGAPWVDGPALAARLNARRLPGVRFYPVSFTPGSSRHAGRLCQGISLVVTDRRVLRPVRVGLEIAAALYALHPETFDLDAAARLLGSTAVLARIRDGDDPAEIAADWEAGEEAFRALRERYLRYPD